ncbi:hypothetical protein Pint_16844 [Pistacia integerrima]|uniref:Uncharacterized protein n=1 Tax=Pistacia integerrima TaxID=434235 RepID=A0ACC0ZH56_9ROSI|nr:hypothetical protein Pint_16844 [Pistacia integerrima]
MFGSVWGHKIYTIYSILFIIFIILLIVTAFFTVGKCVYHRLIFMYDFCYRSFLCGGSTASLSTPIACITTLLAQICLASCKHYFSSATWLVSAMVSSPCLEL